MVENKIVENSMGKSMENRWTANKLGLVNFWYYDMEEFNLSHGKLLFRGSNGSGKSVTMQSFIPFLLDGNKSPERLDPFGTRSRRMENYLLDENTDEKTAYLYIEFKRKNSENYITIGMGMKAVKNRKLDSWYFIITDGRRINVDLNLYRNVGEQIPLTKKQLQNEIGDGGFFTELQKKYMSKVNEILFGFEDSERYEELVNLLIQVRSPKLSKDFKPTKIYDILTESLRVLSEDDLRPMSESMENMDNLKNALEEHERAFRAARNIKYHYDRYNKFCLYDKGNKFFEKYQDLRKLKNELKNTSHELKNKEEELASLNKTIIEKEEELKSAEIKYEELKENDALRVKEELLKLQGEVIELKDSISKKEEELEKKKSIEKERDGKLDKSKKDYEYIKYKVEDMLNKLHELSGEFLFREGLRLKEDILKNIEEYHFDFIDVSLEKYLKEINEAIKEFKLYEEVKKEHDKAFEIKDRLECDIKELENKLERLESILTNEKEELKLKYVKWNDENEIFKLANESMQRLFLAIDKGDELDNLSELVEIVIKEFNNKKNGFNLVIERKKNYINEKEEKIRTLKDEIEELKNVKEVEPLRQEGVIKNRERLAARGIPFVPLYKALDFNKAVSDNDKKAMESALVDMGIIDALIVDEKYKKDALNFAQGENDKFIFTKANFMKHNLTNYFSVDKEELNGVSFETVDNILQGIFLVEDSLAYVDEKGNYGLGALRGKASENYQVKFIGAANRKRHREFIINEKLMLLGELEEEIKKVQLEILQQENYLKQLQSERDKEPKTSDLKEAIKWVKECLDKIEFFQNKLLLEKEELFAISEKLKTRKRMVMESTEGIEISKTRAEFEDAMDAGQDYRKELSQLRIEQMALVSSNSAIINFTESLQEIRETIDNLYYDINNYKNTLKVRELKISSLKDVLSKTDIKEIEEEVERCSKIKEQTPTLLKTINTKRGQLDFKIISLNDTITEKSSLIVEEQGKLESLEEVFLQEYNLGYVIQNQEKDSLGLFKKILPSINLGEGKDREAYSNSLVESLSKNTGELREFALKQTTLFQNTSARVDIRCRVEGKEISFNALSPKIEKDIEEIRVLISGEERRIFEEILLNTISTKIKSKIYLSKNWVDKINDLMESMDTSSSLALSLRWVPKKADTEGQLDIRELLEILEKGTIATEEDMKKLTNHFGNKVKEAIRSYEGTGESRNYHTIIKEVLDYRKWYEFKLFFTKKGERKKELTNNAFFQFSGGEKAMSMYIPLFSAVYARYDNAHKDAPKILAMDEAFAGVDEQNIRDMFRLLKELKIDYIINSQILWGDYDTVDNLSICELIREENDDFVTVIRYHWNGMERVME